MSDLLLRNVRPMGGASADVLIEGGRIDTTPWITHRAPFDEMIGRFPTWLDPANRVVKAMVELAK